MRACGQLVTVVQYLEGEGVGSEGERVAVRLGEAAEEGDGGGRVDEAVCVRVHRRRLLHRASQLRVPGLHAPPPVARSLAQAVLGDFPGAAPSCLTVRKPERSCVSGDGV